MTCIEEKRIFPDSNDSTCKKYTGHTDNLERRLEEHNSGALGRFTKGKGPWRLIHKEIYATRSEAMQREKELKTGKGRDFLRKVTGL